MKGHILKIFFIISVSVVFMSRANSDDSKIQGGVPVSIRQWPYLGSYVTTVFGIDWHTCMTTLITARLALTAAHCVVLAPCIEPDELINFEEEDTDLVEAHVVMGTESPVFPQGYYQKKKIIRAHIHERYSPSAPRPFIAMYDIACLKVRHSFTLRDGLVIVAPLYSSSNDESRQVLRQLTDCRVAGWGYTDVNGSDVAVWWYDRPGILLGSLRQIDVMLMVAEDCCEDNYPDVPLRRCVANLTNTGHGCYEAMRPGEATGGGDSGAPIECAFRGWHNQRVVVGTHVGGRKVIDAVMPYRIVLLPMYRTAIKTMVEFANRMKKNDIPPLPPNTDPPDVTDPSDSDRFDDELK